MSGVSLPLIKIIGDWSSDAVFRYLKPDTNQSFVALEGCRPTQAD
jgi:hypothetical protein